MNNAKPQKEQLYCRTAARLSADIRSGRFAVVPPIRELASHYEVAYPTMWKAVHHLEAEGVIARVGGRRIRVRGQRLPQSVDTFFEALRARIADGSFRIGKPLPKYNHFQREFRVCRNTIAAAFARARHDGLIHKSGKRWIVGAPRQRLGRSVRVRKPTVLIVVATRANWFNLNESSFNQPFTNALLAEFRDFAMHVQLAIERLDSPVTSAPTGLDEILSFIHELGDDYAGTLVGHMQSPTPTMAAWIGEMCRFRRPVVLYDNADSFGAITRQSLGGKESYFRCFFDEQQAVSLALRSLRDLGHRKIGCFYTGGNVEWMRRRVDLIEETAMRLAPEITVFPSRLEDEFGIFDDTRDESSRRLEDPYDIDSFIDRFGRGVSPPGEGGVSSRDSAKQALWEKAGSLRELLQVHKTTAWIAPNDFYQQKLYLWATQVGLRVPEDLSLISFDNSPESFIFPLASIDPGFSYLGHCAAHAFIGDIAVPADRGGNIPSRCRLIDRGSLAHPRVGAEVWAMHGSPLP